MPSREVKYSDPNMYSEGVLAYREQFNLTPNKGFRADIAVTIKTYDDLCMWTDLLAHWGYTDRKTGKWKARNPLDIKGLLTCFEFKQRERQEQRKQLQGVRGNNETSAVSSRSGARLSRRRNRDMPQVSSEPPSEYFRTRKVLF